LKTLTGNRLEAAAASIERRLMPVLQNMADEPHIAAVREAIRPAFVVLFGATVIAFFLVRPQPWVARFLDAYHVGFGVMGVALVALLADQLARSFGYDRVVAVAVSLAAFVVSMPLPIPRNPVLALGSLASSSLFLALIVGLVGAELFRHAGRLIGNRIAATLAASIGMAVVFGGLAAALAPSHHSIADVLLLYFIKPLIGVGNTLPVLLAIIFLQMLLWSTGVHGPAFLAAVTTPIFLGAIDQNGQALVHGQTPPNIVTLSFFAFVYPGGSGATLPLSFLMLRSKIPRLRKLALATLLPTIVNVNEPLIFGVPLVMNPTLAVPFIGVPLLLAVIAYAATALGLVNRTVVYLPGASIPSPINVWLTTHGDWRAVVLLAVNIAIAFACYAPFYRSFEDAMRAAPAAEEQLVKTAEQVREHRVPDIAFEPDPPPGGAP